MIFAAVAKPKKKRPKIPHVFKMIAYVQYININKYIYIYQVFEIHVESGVKFPCVCDRLICPQQLPLLGTLMWTRTRCIFTSLLRVFKSWILGSDSPFLPFYNPIEKL